MLTFNNHYLEDDNAIPNMKVFDAITKKHHREGNYNDDAVYDYLNYLRENGIEMAFKNL